MMMAKYLYGKFSVGQYYHCSMNVQYSAGRPGGAVVKSKASTAAGLSFESRSRGDFLLGTRRASH